MDKRTWRERATAEHKRLTEESAKRIEEALVKAGKLRCPELTEFAREIAGWK